LKVGAVVPAAGTSAGKLIGLTAIAVTSNSAQRKMYFFMMTP
jgi:hypothetical protein